MADETREATIRFREETFPPYHDTHGTPNTLVRRTLEFELAAGRSTWEQTDYGHPGRFNPWDPRGIDTRLQGKTAQLRAAAEAIGELLATG
jgi:hypothetical protein